MEPPTVYAFGPFEFEAGMRRLTRGGRDVTLTDRQATLLLHLLRQPGAVVSKDVLVNLVWGDVAVTDNSVEQVVSSLRRLLKDAAGEQVFVETVPRRGYRLAVEVTRLATRASDDALDALLAPHRIFVEGRAALETLDRQQVARARAAFTTMVERMPDAVSAHVGLANACIMQFEMTRADPAPDRTAVDLAAQHAREACRLDPHMGEAWATLGFVLARTGHRVDALAAARRAVMLEPDNWRHHLRLASVGWGEERLRAAGRTLALLPGFPLAHFLAATVHVARQAFSQAVRELTGGLDAVAAHKGDDGPRFTGVALHWLLGLVRLAQGEVSAALESFERELALEGSGHLYARECAANTWYAKGAMRLRQGDAPGAEAAFHEALRRVPGHRPSMAGLFVGPLVSIARTHEGGGLGFSPADVATVDGAMGVAILATWLDDHLDQPALPAAIGFLDQALASAEPGSEGWIVPVEPLLNVPARPDAWAAVLARLQARAT